MVMIALFKSDDWDYITDDEKFESINNRMDMIFSYVRRKDLRRRYASTEQFAEEYSEENEKEVLIAFQLIKSEYEEIRGYILSNKEKYNVNAQVLEKILEGDIEELLLGEGDE